MRYGISIPPFGDFADIRFLAETAKEAETAGWDGFFLWDHVFFDPSFHANADPWIALAAIALSTSRMRIGALITPLARRRPWIVARQTVSVDGLSKGRLTVGVGLGDPVQWDFAFFNEETDAKVRAQKLDEGLDILTGLWSGQPFRYEGQHYRLEQVKFIPTPIQSPRIPIWVGGNLPNKPPMRRAARWDGFYPIKWGSVVTPSDWRETLGYIRQHRQSDTAFDAVQAGAVPLDQWSNAASLITPYAEVGVTWWIEDVSPWRFGQSWESQWTQESTRRMSELIRQGPPHE